jgi:hippurate hydrolase
VNARTASLDIDGFIRIRRDFHVHPELSCEETRTSETIARLLSAWGYDVHTGLGGHGVVGLLRRGHGSKCVAIRADFDALPIQEETGLAYESKYPGKMHACGHDGHTAILLAAAHALARKPVADGTFAAVFQPAEELGHGARAMFEEGLLERFDFDAVFGLHNIPGMPVGTFGFRAGPFWAAVDNLDVEIQGFGGHGGLPQLARDPLVAGAQMVLALQTIVSRNTDPLDAVVVTLGAFHSGKAHNVIPDTATLAVNVRSFTPAVRETTLKRIEEITTRLAGAMQVDAEVRLLRGTPAVVNDPAMTHFARDVARELFGPAKVLDEMRRMSVSDDFSEFLARRPGSYIVIGNGEQSFPLHHPKYDFNDDLIAPAAAYWSRLVSEYLRRQGRRERNQEPGGGYLVRRIENGSAEQFSALPDIWATDVSSRELALAPNREDEMKRPRRKFLHLAAGAAVLSTTSRIAWAQAYPTRPVRIISGFPSGGVNDIYARLIGQWLSERLGQQFFVENRPGAGGTLATELAARAAPDGYTLIVATSADAWNATLYDNLKFNFIRDFAPVATISRGPGLLVVHPAVPPQSVLELITYAKSNPGKITVASAGIGSAPHMYWELFRTLTEVDMLHVPYRGGGPALTDLLGGQVQVYFGTTASSIEYVRTGRLRALAVTTATRAAALPDIPALAEFLPTYEASLFVGIVAPRNTPAEIINRLNQEINFGLADSKMTLRIAEFGDIPLLLSTSEFAKLIVDETAKWGKVIRTANIKPQ